MRQFRLVHMGVAAAMAAATVTALGLVQSVGAESGGTSSVFVPIAPCRLLDTRAGGDNVGARSTPLGATETATFAVWGPNGNCALPSTATGIATNATAVNPSAASYVSIFPADANPRPTASNLNVVAGGAPTPNQVTVGLSAAGAISIYNNSGTVDMIIDVVGYYQAATIGSGPQGPQGVQGLQGPQGQPGPACPVAGCTIFVSGLDAVPRQGSTSSNITFVANQCAWGQIVDLGLSLPFGAVIAKVTVRYQDLDTSSNGFLELAVYKVTSPTGVEIAASGNPPTVTGQTSIDVPLNSSVTPVAADSTYYVEARSHVGASPVLLLCGVAVTYHF